MKTDSKNRTSKRVGSLARGSGSGNCEEYLRRNLAVAKAAGAVAGLDKLRAQLNLTKYQPAWLKKALFEVAKRIEELPPELANWRDSSPDSPFPNRCGSATPTGTSSMTTENEIKPAAPAEAIDGGRCAVEAGFGVWAPIETAPKDGTRILCSYRGNRSFIARWRDDFSVFMDDWESWRDVTHWMPLPPSPNIPR